MAQRKEARGARKRRSEAFKHNLKKYGARRALFIARIITEKQAGIYNFTEKDGIREK